MVISSHCWAEMQPGLSPLSRAVFVGAARAPLIHLQSCLALGNHPGDSAVSSNVENELGRIHAARGAALAILPS